MSFLIHAYSYIIICGVNVHHIYDNEPLDLLNGTLFNGSYLIHNDYIYFGALDYLDDIQSRNQHKMEEANIIKKFIIQNKIEIHVDPCSTFDRYYDGGNEVLLTNIYTLNETYNGRPYFSVTFTWLTELYEKRIKDILSLISSKAIKKHDDLIFFVKWMKYDKMSERTKQLGQNYPILQVSKEKQHFSLCNISKPHVSK